MTAAEEFRRFAQRGADAIDIGYDRAGHRRLCHLAVVHETVLQIDDDVRSLARIEAVENGDAAPVARSSFTDRVVCIWRKRF
ncbi:hypothetical protein GCM10010869_55140 [Mesorhizobium tianshanense]|nr:hypothetical protein GCM10010869_55140 [Mesorhizobium tianshanense]